MVEVRVFNPTALIKMNVRWRLSVKLKRWRKTVMTNWPFWNAMFISVWKKSWSASKPRPARPALARAKITNAMLDDLTRAQWWQIALKNDAAMAEVRP